MKRVSRPLFLSRLTLGLALVAVTVSCKAPVNRSRPSATGGLTAQEFRRLRAINEAQSNALETVRKVSEGQSKQCGTKERHTEEPDASQRWSTRTKVFGTDHCPVQFLKEWIYDSQQKKLNFRHELKTNRESKLTYRRATGSIQSEGGERDRTLLGTIHYDRIEISGIGFVDVEIQTLQRFARAKSTGEIRVIVKQGTWSHVGVMRWRAGRSDKTIYEVDGRSITEDGFNQLFSAYGLPEIMANSKKMR